MNLEQGFSTEVVGKLSPQQEQELQYLGGFIFQDLELDANNQEHLEMVKHILADCVVRGVKIRGRQWVGPNESIAEVFTAGLDQRERIVKSLKQIQSTDEYSPFFDNSYLGIINLTQVLSKDISPGEELLNRLDLEKRQIDKLHQELFEKSTLHHLAAILKEDRVKADQSIGTKESSWQINNRLFSNILVHLGLYRSFGIEVEPKDLVELLNVWKDEEVRKASQQGVIEQFLYPLAQRFNLEKLVMAKYSKYIFDWINLYATRGVSLEEAATSTYFIFLTVAIDRERDEILQREGPKEYREMVIAEEVEEAELKYQEVEKRYLEHDLKVKKKVDTEEDREEYAKFFQNITSLELIYTLKDFFANKREGNNLSFAGSLIMEIEEMIPSQTYIEALPLIFAEKLVNEEGDEIEDLAEARFNNEVKGLVVEKAMEALFRDEELLNNMLAIFHPLILTEIFIRLPAESLAFQAKILEEIGAEKWIEVLKRAGVTFNIMDERLYFSPDSDNLADYIDLLPEELVKEVKKGLSQSIQV